MKLCRFSASPFLLAAIFVGLSACNGSDNNSDNGISAECRAFSTRNEEEAKNEITKGWNHTFNLYWMGSKSEPVNFWSDLFNNNHFSVTVSPLKLNVLNEKDQKVEESIFCEHDALNAAKCRVNFEDILSHLKTLRLQNMEDETTLSRPKTLATTCTEQFLKFQITKLKAIEAAASEATRKDMEQFLKDFDEERKREEAAAGDDD